MGEAVEQLDLETARLAQTPSATPTATPTVSPTVTPTSTPSPEAGPTLAEIEALVDSRVSTALTAVPSPTPVAPPTPGPSLEEVQSLVEATVSEAIEAIPSPTPLVLSTAGPSLEEVEALVEERVAAAIAAIPTPRATSTPVVLGSGDIAVSQISGPVVTTIAGDITLEVDPGQPFAGRDVSFAVEGIEPWQAVIVELVDPRGEPAAWITEDEAFFSPVNGTPVTDRTLFADESGRATWLRIGTMDREGVWAVRVTVNGETTGVSYPVGQLQLDISGNEDVGVEFRRYQGSVSDIYFSSLVPAALVLDLQSHLGWVVAQVTDEYGIQSTSIPDIYLTSDRRVLEVASDAVGVELGFEDGYFKSGGERPGVYMRTDSLRGEVRGLLTHEYVHLVLNEISRMMLLPAWLDEGFAKFVEVELGLRSDRPEPLRRSLYGSANTAKTAALSGALLSLPVLESRSDWNAQRVQARIEIQYAESHMAVRFLVDTWGIAAPVDVVIEMRAGSDLSQALEEVTGISYRTFEDRFVAWLTDWEDLERAGVREYIEVLLDVLESERGIAERRAAELGSGLPPEQLVAPRVALVNSARDLETALEAVSPPSTLISLHGEALEYFGRLVECVGNQHKWDRLGPEKIIIMKSCVGAP